MISKLAVRLTNYLYSEGTISAEDKELYQYGFFLLFSRIMFLLVTMFVGLAANVFWESLLFYVMFSVLRGYAGGVHASSEFACDTLSTGTFIVSVICIRIMKSLKCVPLALIMTAVGCFIIHWLSPMDTNAKPLSKAEFKHYRKVCSILTILYFLLEVVFIVLSIYNFLYAVSVSILLETVLLFTGYLKKTQIRN
ncbi:MAG: accessory gene regulator B family protein [Lachnospiraceae bacterium]|nr:accessory gene regulator B family protein [Lachnospiraceae bacterium]